MATIVQCRCGHRIPVGRSFQGRTIVCPDCGAMQPVPVRRGLGERLGLRPGLAGYPLKVALALLALGAVSVVLKLIYALMRD